MQTEANPSLVDTSELLRGPSQIMDGSCEKGKDEFRNYDDSTNKLMDMVKKTYVDMHTNQCVKFVKEKVILQ